MTKILIVCSGGMSSSIVEKALVKEGAAQDKNVTVNAVGSALVDDELSKGGYEILLVAPQVKYMFDAFKIECAKYGVPCEVIQPREYTSLGAKNLLERVFAVLQSS